MNASELAKKMLEWEELAVKLSALEAEIKEAVLGIGKTQTVGNVRASYSGGRKSYNYKLAIAEAIGDARICEMALEPFEEVKVDYSAACKAFSIKAPFTKSEPKVTVTLLK